MANTRVIPILLLQNDRLVKTIKFKSPTYIGDPINAIKLFNELEADELVLLDIIVTKKKKSINYELIKQISSECFMPLAYGGGIKTIEDMKTLFTIGVEKIILNSAAVNDPNLIKQASQIFGNQSILVSIDVKKTILGYYKVWIVSGTKKTNLDYIDWSKNIEKLGTGEILINSIDHDGTMKGYDLKLIRNISDAVSVPVIAVGGAGNFDHLRDAVIIGNASAVGAGSLFVYHGKKAGILINYPNTEELEKIFHAEQQ